MATVDSLHDHDIFSLAELARASGVTDRTIRYYQAENLLPKPAKHGRDAVYGNAHLERIRLIVELRDRGLTLGNIRELVANDNPIRTVSTWLGVDATLTAPWSDDRSRTVTSDELRALIGDSPRGVLADLQAAKYAIPGTGGTWTVPSPALLDLALQLHGAGVDVEIAGRIRDLLRHRLSKAVNDAVKLLVERAGSGFAGSGTAEEIERALGALRPIAREMSSLILAQEVERALAGLAEKLPREIGRDHRTNRR